MKRTTRKKTKVIVVTATILIAACFTVLTADKITEKDAQYIPDYLRIDLKSYTSIKAADFSDADYETLFRQTGLGRDAVDSVFNSSEAPVEALEAYQEAFFNPPAYTCYKIGIGSREESFLDGGGNAFSGFQIADVRVGDIVISKCTHSVGWRHGHAGIVIDAQKGKTFEAIYPGTVTMVQNLSKWQTFPTFVLLRPKEPWTGEKAAAIAFEDLQGIYWRHYAGLFEKKGDSPRVTQCSHLIWYAYFQLGYDIDSDGLWPVTPKDIVNSEYFEVVQIFGVDPDRIWK